MRIEAGVATDKGRVREGNEVAMALDAATGKIVWQTSYPAAYKMNPATKPHGEGPKSTPLYYQGTLYTLGIGGIVSAFDASNGKLLWQKPAPSVDPLPSTMPTTFLLTIFSTRVRIWPFRLPAVPEVPQRYSNWS